MLYTVAPLASDYSSQTANCPVSPSCTGRHYTLLHYDENSSDPDREIQNAIRSFMQVVLKLPAQIMPYERPIVDVKPVEETCETYLRSEFMLVC
nr:unnamed protein product [Spirometra erinaceieuropaei]